MKKDEKSTKRTTLMLPCVLTPDEQRERGLALAQRLEDIKGEEKRHEMLKAEMKSSMSALEAARDSLALVVSRGEEMRRVEVEEVLDYKADTFTRSRLDTGEVLISRPLADSERQLPIA